MTTSRISPDFSNKFHGYFQPKINASSIFGAVKIAQGMDCSALSLENQVNLHLWSVQLISINQYMIDQLIYICEAIYVNWYVLIIHEILDTRWPTALSHEVWHRREPLGIAGALPEDALRVLGSFSGSGKSCSGGGRTLGTTGKHGNTRYRGFHKWGIPGYPQKWMVYFMETPIYKWMTGGTPISGNLYIYGDYGDQFFVGWNGWTSFTSYSQGWVPGFWP